MYNNYKSRKYYSRSVPKKKKSKKNESLRSEFGQSGRHEQRKESSGVRHRLCPDSIKTRALLLNRGSNGGAGTVLV